MECDARAMTSIQSICVFCGSAAGADPSFLRAAQETGAWIVRQGLTLVYGGARIGLMGALADSALAAGGKVIGVIPRGLQEREIAHTGLTRLHLTETMHERQRMMTDLADAFLVLPGGYGTLAEFFEVLTWKQIGLHAKPIGVLNTGGYWDFLTAHLEKAGRAGFTRETDAGLYSVISDPSDISLLFREKILGNGKVLHTIG